MSSTSTPSQSSSAQPAPPRKKKSKSEYSTKELLLSGLAGGLAGCAAKTAVAPLDRAKILFILGVPKYEKYAGTYTGVFKAAGDIWRETGFRGLLQGHSATLLRIFPYAGIKFMAYDHMHKLLMPTKEDETGYRLFAAGSISGVVSVFFTYPLELIRVRLAYEVRQSAEQRTNLLRTINLIYHEGEKAQQRRTTTAASSQIPHPNPIPSPHSPSIQNTASPSPSLPHSRATPTRAVALSHTLFAHFPILKFYRGFSPTLIGMIPYAGTSFLTWGLLRQESVTNRFLPPHTLDSKTRKTLYDLTCGGIAGAISQTASYPFEVVRRRMQVQGLFRPDRLVGFWETANEVWKSRGWRGFFVGLSIGYLKVVPMTAISFMTWTFFKREFGLER